jgi:hypothetical protein
MQLTKSRNVLTDLYRVYPRSHRLPRLYTRMVPADKVRDGNWHPFVEKYSPTFMELIKHAELKPFYYTPKTGSALIWHETLAHGGSQRKSDSITRKSMVVTILHAAAWPFTIPRERPAGRTRTDRIARGRADWKRAGPNRCVAPSVAIDSRTGESRNGPG